MIGRAFASTASAMLLLSACSHVRSSDSLPDGGSAPVRVVHNVGPVAGSVEDIARSSSDVVTAVVGPVVHRFTEFGGVPEVDPVSGFKRPGQPYVVVQLSIAKELKSSRPAPAKQIALVLPDLAGVVSDSFSGLAAGSSVLLFLHAVPASVPTQPSIADLTAKFGPLFILAHGDADVFDIRGSQVICHVGLPGLQSSDAKPTPDGLAPASNSQAFAYADVENVVAKVVATG